MLLTWEFSYLVTWAQKYGGGVLSRILPIIAANWPVQQQQNTAKLPPPKILCRQ